LKKKIYGVAGFPVLHSRSPEMFNRLFKNTENIYTRFSSNNPKEIIKIIKDLGISGLNITTPLKEVIIEYIDYSSDDVVRTKAVNTIVYRDGALYGYNTDPAGVSNSILKKGINVRGKKSVVIGSGGAGRAAVCGLQDLGSKVYLTNRTGKKLDYYSELLNCDYFKINEIQDQIKKADIVVNTAPFSLVKSVLKKMNGNQVLFNADYKEEIDIKLNPILIDGLSWLLYQGAYSYKIFFKEEPDLQQMEDSIRKVNREKNQKKIILMGFMGSGKSTLGRYLGKISGKKWIDSDNFIELLTGKKIEDIFYQDGEGKFRKIEEKVLVDLLRIKKYPIISVGGGAVINKLNRILFKSNAINIWVWCSVNKIEERLMSGKRPLITKKSDIKRYYSNRIGFYGEVADIVIPNTRDIKEVSKRIKMELDWE